MTSLHDKISEHELDEQTRARLEALFEVHQQIAADIGEAQTAPKDIDDYIAGQQEALNRVEELITLMVTDDRHPGLGDGESE